VNTYLGHADIEPIWAELRRRRAVVFVHPTQPVDTAKVNDKMPQPMIDYPHETTRAAMDMIMAGTRRKYPGCKVILSHAGGALPYLISRVAELLRKAPDAAARWRTGTTHEMVMSDFRSFHSDLALSSAPGALRMLLDMVPHRHILYGVSFRPRPL
jgi:predicted TIM-barrel fold metal-dependent hydrolase